MNVAELIAELEQQNPEAPVLDDNNEEAYNVDTDVGGEYSGLPEIETGYVVISFGDPLAPPKGDPK